MGAKRQSSETRIGISGWRYAPWRRAFYPAGLPQKSELAFAARQFNSIEINGSFYSLQRVESWQRWYDETPEDFVFAVKGGRFITHMKKLNNIEKPLANFFAQGVLALKHKLGPILWQFPPGFAFDHDRFEQFFELLPRTMKEALALARHRDSRMNGRTYLRAVDDHSLKHAVEIRHESFRTPDFIRLLRKHSIGLVVADTAGKWPFLEDVTSDFVYARLHGDKELYVSGYTSTALGEWAKRVRAWNSGTEIPDGLRVSAASIPKRPRSVYVYFDNDVKVRAPFDAIELSRRIDGFLPKHSFGRVPRRVTEQARTSWPAVRSRVKKEKGKT
jgi:uncharacterized protein YecE (DUF72 family)